MRKATYLFLLLGCLVLSSCRDMFNKMIEYKGNEEPPVLCLNADVKVGSPLKVYLTHSWFFLDENRYVGNPANNIQRRGIVKDATVEMQVNNGEWKPLSLVEVSDTVLYGTKVEGMSYYTSTYAFQAGDIVTIRASHPDYKTITATETVPSTPVVSVTLNEPREKVLSFTLSLDPLPNDKDQLIFFSITAFGYVNDTTDNYVIRDYNTDAYVYDTVVRRYPIACQFLYSEDFMFSEYDLPQTRHNYYAQNGPLYTSADHFADGGQVTLLLDLDKYKGNGGEVVVDTLGRDTIVGSDFMLTHSSCVFDTVIVNVRLINESFYMYRTTLLGKSSRRTAPEISFYAEEGGSTDIGDIFEELGEIFDELGNQEGTQAFTNVENGFGHLSFITQKQQIIPIHYEVEDTRKEYYY